MPYYHTIMESEGSNTPPASASPTNTVDPVSEEWSKIIEAVKSIEYTPSQYERFRSRSPFYIASQKMLNKGMELIQFGINPQSVDFSLPTRGAIEQARMGWVYHAWSKTQSRDNETFDNLRVTLNIDTGSLLLFNAETAVGELGALRGTKPGHGLKTFWRIISLIKEEKILEDDKTNWIYLIFSSVAFPQMTFKGFIVPSSIDWQESTGSPNSFSYRIEMVVHEMTPPIWDYSLLENAFTASGINVNTSVTDDVTSSNPNEATRAARNA